MRYFQEDDVLRMMLAERQEARSVELSPNVTAEFDKQGEPIGIEILEASSFIRSNCLAVPQTALFAKTGRC